MPRTGRKMSSSKKSGVCCIWKSLPADSPARRQYSDPPRHRGLLLLLKLSRRTPQFRATPSSANLFVDPASLGVVLSVIKWDIGPLIVLMWLAKATLCTVMAKSIGSQPLGLNGILLSPPLATVPSVTSDIGRISRPRPARDAW